MRIFFIQHIIIFDSEKETRTIHKHPSSPPTFPLPSRSLSLSLSSSFALQLLSLSFIFHEYKLKHYYHSV